MRRSVAAAEGSPVPPPEGGQWLLPSRQGEMQGVPNPCGYHPRNLMRAPIGNFSHTSTNRLVIPTSQPGEPSAILATNYATKEIEDGSPEYLFINGLVSGGSSPAVRTIRIRGSENHWSLSGLPFSGNLMATNPISRRSSLCISRNPPAHPLTACARATRPCACQFARSVQRHDH